MVYDKSDQGPLCDVYAILKGGVVMECWRCQKIMNQGCMCGDDKEVTIEYHCPECGTTAILTFYLSKNELKESDLLTEIKIENNTANNTDLPF